ALHAVRKEFLGAIDVVDAPGDDVGPDVDLQVVRALERFPGPVGNTYRFLRSHFCHGLLDVRTWDGESGRTLYSLVDPGFDPAIIRPLSLRVLAREERS